MRIFTKNKSLFGWIPQFVQFLSLLTPVKESKLFAEPVRNGECKGVTPPIFIGDEIQVNYWLDQINIKVN